MGYDFTKGEGLYFNRGRRLPPQPCVLKGKSIKYYSKTKHDLGYTYASELEMNVFQEDSSKNTPVQSSPTSSWDSNYGLRRLFWRMIVNTVFVTHLDQVGSDGKVPLKLGHKKLMHSGNFGSNNMNLKRKINSSRWIWEMVKIPNSYLWVRI